VCANGLPLAFTGLNLPLVRRWVSRLAGGVGNGVGRGQHSILTHQYPPSVGYPGLSPPSSTRLAISTGAARGRALGVMACLEEGVDRWIPASDVMHPGRTPQPTLFLRQSDFRRLVRFGSVCGATEGVASRPHDGLA
jgi:hypothetical protein